MLTCSENVFIDLYNRLGFLLKIRLILVTGMNIVYCSLLCYTMLKRAWFHLESAFALDMDLSAFFDFFNGLNYCETRCVSILITLYLIDKIMSQKIRFKRSLVVVWHTAFYNSTFIMCSGENIKFHDWINHLFSCNIINL